MIYPSLFSILFFSVCIVSLVSGIFVIHNNHKAPANRCFFALVTSVSFWSAGLAFANLAPDVTTCEIWRRLSAVGWGTAYAITLHFFLIITGKNNLLRRWWFYILLYLPAVITVLAFAIPSGLNPVPYRLLHTKYGWTNVKPMTEQNIWDWIFKVYYAGYVIVGLVIVLLWGKKSSEHNIKMQSRAIFISFGAALVLATLTDVVLGNFFAKLPQMAPVILLIPIVTISRTMKRYRFILPEQTVNKSSYIRLVGGVILYVVFLYAQMSIPSGSGIIGIDFLNESALRGILTQLQMIISIYLVLMEEKPGFIAAIILNTAGIFGSASYMIRSGTTIPLPGIISGISAVLMAVLIFSYKKRMNDNIRKINNQRKNLKENERKLYQMAYYDTLTGLHNKDWFVEQLSRTIHTAKRNAALIGVMFIDIDSFKSVNDTLGHSTGDEALKLIANRISACLRQDDAITRFGGDEYLIMLNNIKKPEALQMVCDRIMDAFKSPISLQDVEYFVTASAGVAVYPVDGQDPETLIKNADIAMYLAKNRGKNQCIFCSSDIKNDTIRKMKLTNKLYRALDKNELYLHYQPQIKAQTQEIIGFEALLRWNTDEYGIVPPNVFIPMAEQTGLIRPIGLWVFKTACEQLKVLRNCCKRDISMAVNLSIEQLKDSDIAEKIGNLLAETGVDAGDIEIEITESIAFNEDPYILQRIKEIKSLGISIAIDDFGTGYSSFTRLKTFPIDLLKIDINFVHGISSGSEKDKAIIKSIIQIAKNLDIDVLAEGVETEQQYIYLRDNGCNIIQGYYFYKPMPPDEAGLILKDTDAV